MFMDRTLYKVFFHMQDYFNLQNIRTEIQTYHHICNIVPAAIIE